jgi:hypothetical protein
MGRGKRKNRKGNKKLRVSAYWKHRNTRLLRYGHGKYPSALRCARTTQWEYDPWHKRTAGPHLCCTWERWEASRGPSTKSASSVFPCLFAPFSPPSSLLARSQAGTRAENKGWLTREERRNPKRIWSQPTVVFHTN